MNRRQSLATQSWSSSSFVWRKWVNFVTEVHGSFPVMSIFLPRIIARWTSQSHNCSSKPTSSSSAFPISVDESTTSEVFFSTADGKLVSVGLIGVGNSCSRGLASAPFWSSISAEVTRGSSLKPRRKEMVLVATSSPTDLFVFVTLCEYIASTPIWREVLGSATESLSCVCLLEMLRTSLSKYFRAPLSWVPIMLLSDFETSWTWNELFSFHRFVLVASTPLPRPKSVNHCTSSGETTGLILPSAAAVVVVEVAAGVVVVIFKALTDNVKSFLSTVAK